MSLIVICFALMSGSDFEVTADESAAAPTEPQTELNVDQLARRFRIDIYESFRKDRPAYDFHRELGDEAFKLSRFVDRGSENETAIKNWFVAARNSVATNGPLPALPELVDFESSLAVRGHADQATEPESSDQDEFETTVTSEGRSQPNDSVRTREKKGGIFNSIGRAFLGIEDEKSPSVFLESGESDDNLAVPQTEFPQDSEDSTDTDEFFEDDLTSPLESE